MPSWIERAIIYHIYPLGLLGAPRRNDPAGGIEHRLPRLHDWSEHIAGLGCNAIYLGPLFESMSHGYDTIDYTRVDRRLGDNADLADLIAHYHDRGFRVILDGVFNHVSREFPAFRDLLEHGERSSYRDWFVDVDFSQQSPLGDRFSYYAYEGNFDLVKLNLSHPEVRQHLFSVARFWFNEFAADGIRLDAVDAIDHQFLRDFAAVCREANPDCWLMGEVVNGDYRQWTGPGELDSCTNYEAFKGLYSTFNDRNMYEIAWSLNRQFGAEGIYRHLSLYSFADNHDVNRVATLLHRSEDLASLYTLLYTIPGAPSIYYGSEWGITGDKEQANDEVLRPALDLPLAPKVVPQPWLAGFIARLSAIRQASAAIRHGDYTELHVAPEQFAFGRAAGSELAIIVVNAASATVDLDLKTAYDDGMVLTDQLDPATSALVEDGRIQVALTANSARVLVCSQL
jgi:glycosidase